MLSIQHFHVATDIYVRLGKRVYLFVVLLGRYGVAMLCRKARAMASQSVSWLGVTLATSASPRSELPSSCSPDSRTPWLATPTKCPRQYCIGVAFRILSTAAAVLLRAGM